MILSMDRVVAVLQRSCAKEGLEAGQGCPYLGCKYGH